MNEELLHNLIRKSNLLKKVEGNTQKAMLSFTEVAQDIETFLKENTTEEALKNNVCFTQSNDSFFEMQFNDDVLVFVMPPDVFEFSRNHEVMRSPYIKEDRERSYCGMILIYNFLANSLENKRMNDSGYMIGRILINKDGHYFVEGKKEISQILNNFTQNEFSKETALEIMTLAIKYTLNFDLLLPDFNMFKEINVSDILYLKEQVMTLKTAKRLGFRFEKDTE